MFVHILTLCKHLAYDFVIFFSNFCFFSYFSNEHCILSFFFLYKEYIKLTKTVRKKSTVIFLLFSINSCLFRIFTPCTKSGTLSIYSKIPCFFSQPSSTDKKPAISLGCHSLGLIHGCLLCYTPRDCCSPPPLCVPLSR